MKRLKTFLLYAFIIAAFWLFSDILIYLAINSSYAHVETKVYTNTPEIIVGDSKATYVNGYVKGGIKNNTDSILDGEYLKIDLYSKRNVKLGTKYVKIENLPPNEYKEFEMWYKFTDVDYATLTVVDSVKDATEKEFISQKTAGYIVVGTLLVLYFI